MLPRRLIFSIILFLLPLALTAQTNERKDSLVRLLGCDSLLQEDVEGHSFRKAIGKARFEHNSTLLLCDSALWNVDENVIRAFGNVRIIQNKTVLSSDSLIYYIGSSQAEFRGSLVQLQDKDRNTLRTRNLDYNTRDSMAVFRQGGAFRDKDGQIIESDLGVYDAKKDLFTFVTDVNMYTDSVFIKTDELKYNTETSVALFGSGTNAWKDDNMLSSDSGVYDRVAELFTFRDNVHLLTRNQEAWSDTLVYEREFDNVEMIGNVELLDTTRNVAAVAGYMQYVDSLERIRMTRDPSVIAVQEQQESKDTVYVRGDELLYWTIPLCDVPDHSKSTAEARLKELSVDPVTEYRRKAYEAAKAAAEEARKKMEEEDPNFAAARLKPGAKGGKAVEEKEPPKEETPPPATAPEPPPAAGDTVAVADSLPPEVDSTKMGFFLGLRNVKVFRKDMQVACDSLVYTDLDSLVRLYNKPVVWNEIRRQYSSDSITVVLRNRALEKASLMSNAFIIVQEDSLCFDQIKGAEMMAYFDSTGVLSRFDAMGGASGVFFLEENDVFATVNKFEAKMLTATFVEGNINDLNYFEGVKSDAYPVVQLKREDRILKGFEWRADDRPKGPEDVVAYTPRKSERARYENVPRATFTQTEKYFPGHIDHINRTLASADSLRRVRRAEREAAEAARRDSLALVTLEKEPAVSDTLAVRDSLAAKDTLASAIDSLSIATALKDSVAAVDSVDVSKAFADSVKTARMDSLMKALAVDPSEAEKAMKKSEREARRALQDSLRQEKAARKEAKWAALDAKDAEKAAKKEAKAEAKRQEKLRKMLIAKEKRDAKEQRILERYKARYEKKKARKEAAALKRQEREK